MKCTLFKKFLWCLGAFMLSLAFSLPANACTAFSVKTDTNVYFAKNWDYYPDSEKYVTIHLEPMADGLSRLVFRYQAVSYTHLDVYKRQLVLHLQRFQLTVFLRISFEIFRQFLYFTLSFFSLFLFSCEFFFCFSGVGKAI